MNLMWKYCGNNWNGNSFSGRQFCDLNWDHPLMMDGDFLFKERGKYQKACLLFKMPSRQRKHRVQSIKVATASVVTSCGCQEAVLSEGVKLQTFVATMQILSFVVIGGVTLPLWNSYSLIPGGNDLLIILAVLLWYCSNRSKR